MGNSDHGTPPLLCPYPPPRLLLEEDGEPEAEACREVRVGGRESHPPAGAQRFRRGLVFKAHRLLYHSTLDLRVIKKKERRSGTGVSTFWHRTGGVWTHPQARAPG